MPGLDVVELALAIGVIAATITHPGSGKLSDVGVLRQVARRIALHAAHIFFVLVISIFVNNSISYPFVRDRPSSSPSVLTGT